MPHWCTKQLRKHVAHCGDNTLHNNKLGTSKINKQFHLCLKQVYYLSIGYVTDYICINCQQNEHQEEADTPKLWQGHHSCCLRVSNEGQTWTCEVNEAKVDTPYIHMLHT